MGVRKLETKSILKNTFYRKSNGNLISQLKILILFTVYWFLSAHLGAGNFRLNSLMSVEHI